MKMFRYVLALAVAAAFLASWMGPAEGGGKQVTIGFIYVGPKDDYGYNQAHAAGAAAVKKMPGVTVKEAELIPENVTVQKTMQGMIQLNNAQIIFPTSFGYFEHILAIAPKY